MINKKLGKTNIQVSAIGLGTGDFFWNSDLSYTDKIKIIRIAVENGINIIDTAEEYGKGISEKIVGEAIHDIRDKVVISSKFSPQHHNYKNVIRCCNESLKRLKIKVLDIYQVHWPNPVIPLKETIDALKSLYQDGKIRAVGVGNYSLREIKEVQKYLSEIPLFSIQMEYNLFERTIEENGILNYSIKNNSLLLAYSPLDQGQTSIISPDRKKILIELSKKYNRSPQQIILNFLTSRSSVVTLIRTTSKKHLLQNAQATNFELSKEDIILIENTFPIKYEKVPVNIIKISLKGEWNHSVYNTIDEAIENKFKFTPSPLDLAESLKRGDYLKPVRLKCLKEPSKKFNYELTGGRIRFWAWIIAFGNQSEIPAYIREDYSNLM